MSYFRAKSRTSNQNVYNDNKLATFTKPPVVNGDLYVERNEVVGGNLDVSGSLTANNFYARGNYYLNNYILIPYGTIIQCAAVNVPDGWLFCDGSQISKLVYANLFGAIGYTYGGSGNNFNVPDIQGRAVIGSGSGSGLTARTLGSKGGAETHTLTVDEMPSHSHTSNAVGGTIGLMTSTGANTASTGLDTTTGEANLFSTLQALTINSTGGGNAHNNMQPYIALRYLIKY